MTESQIEKMVADINKETVKEHTEMRKLLVDIIRTLDEEFFLEVQNTKNPIGLLRSKVDDFLNR
jgi:hypothetical protein